METAEVLERSPQFQEVWAILERIGRRQEEFEKEQKEWLKDFRQEMGRIGRRFGESVEYMVLPNLVKKFRERGFTFTKAAPRVDITDRDLNVFLEVDAFMENGDSVMIVETKVKPSVRDIDDHVDRMEKLRIYADAREDRRKYYGAVAGQVVMDNIRDYALKNGFYVLVPSGSTFDIVEPEGEYRPRAW
jgi:hypothetical protein